MTNQPSSQIGRVKICQSTNVLYTLLPWQQCHCGDRKNTVFLLSQSLPLHWIGIQRRVDENDALVFYAFVVDFFLNFVSFW